MKDKEDNLHVPCWIYQKDEGIPHDVCDYYYNKWSSKKAEPAKVEIENKKQKNYDEKVNKKTRDVKTIQLPTYTGITSYLVAASLDANFQNWKYKLSYCSQSEYLIYKRNGKYTTHVDYSFKTNQDYVRKLTCLTVLNDNFKGGLFYLVNGVCEKFFPPQEKCNIIIFPSWTLHGCETVYEGQRHAVVAWMNGKQYT